MRRFHKRRKPMVRWLQDVPDTFPPVQVASTGGKIETFAVGFLNELASTMPDPAEVERLSVTSGLEFKTPRGQLLTQPGWRMMRAVGTINISMLQTDDPVAPGANDSRGCIVRAGLAILDTNDAGDPVNTSEVHLGPRSIPIDDDAKGAWMAGVGNSCFLWMRHWKLGNAGAGTAPVAGNPTTIKGDGPVYPGGALSQLHEYPQGPAANWQFPSIHLGAYFDIKRHVTLKPNQGLFWLIAAYDIDFDSEAAFKIEYSIQRRVLIAKAGRTYREKP